MSDYLNRHSVTATENPSRQSRIAEEYVIFIADQDVPKAMTMQEIVQETSEDSDLQSFRISGVIHGIKRTHHPNTLLHFRVPRIS